MMKSLSLALLAGVSLACSGAALAQMAPAAKSTVAAKTTTHKMVAAKTTTSSTAPTSGRMVTTKTKTGKTVTYNCSKAGNANKTACKK